MLKAYPSQHSPAPSSCSSEIALQGDDSSSREPDDASQHRRSFSDATMQDDSLHDAASVPGTPRAMQLLREMSQTSATSMHEGQSRKDARVHGGIPSFAQYLAADGAPTFNQSKQRCRALLDLPPAEAAGHALAAEQEGKGRCGLLSTKPLIDPAFLCFCAVSPLSSLIHVSIART